MTTKEDRDLKEILALEGQYIPSVSISDSMLEQLSAKQVDMQAKFQVEILKTRKRELERMQYDSEERDHRKDMKRIRTKGR